MISDITIKIMWDMQYVFIFQYVMCLNNLSCFKLIYPNYSNFLTALSYTAGPRPRGSWNIGLPNSLGQGYCCTVAGAIVHQQTWHQLIILVSGSVEVRQTQRLHVCCGYFVLIVVVVTCFCCCFVNGGGFEIFNNVTVKWVFFVWYIWLNCASLSFYN